MKGFVVDLEQLSKDNLDFRRVLYTAKKLQLVLMSVEPGDEIGEEVHPDHDQFIRIEKGQGEVWIDGQTAKIKRDFAVVIPAGTPHNVRNTGDKPLKLYTIYAPPEHVDKTVHRTKVDALAEHETSRE